MAREIKEFLNQVLAGYAGNYDIEEKEIREGELPLAATAVLHVSESGFVLSRKAEMWSANSDEYVYFFTVPTLTDSLTEEAIRYAYDDGMSHIDLVGKKNHMCTRITAVFLCEGAEEAALERVRKCRLYKSFQFSLKGWMEFHAVAVDLGKESVTGNHYGRQTAEFMRDVLKPKKQKKSARALGILGEMLK